jgi:sortase A
VTTTQTDPTVTVGGPATTGDDTEPERPPAVPGRRRARVRTIVGRIAAVIVLVLVAYVFFGAFITHLWYQTRQRSLAANGFSLVAPKTGQTVGVLQVSSPFVLNVQILQGDNPSQLRDGPGHRPDTPLPGTIGNSVVYGHEKEWGAPFGNLKKAIPGTAMYLRTPKGTILAYDVTAARIVPASQVAAYLGKSTDYRLTLVTDSGGITSGKRLVVIAVSGTKGSLAAAPVGIRAGPGPSGAFGLTLLALIGWIAAAVLVTVLLRRTHNRVVVAAAVLPLALAALVAAFLEIGLLINPLA